MRSKTVPPQDDTEKKRKVCNSFCVKDNEGQELQTLVMKELDII